MEPLIHPLACPLLPAWAPALLTGQTQLLPSLPPCAPCALADLMSFAVPASVMQQHILGGTSTLFSALPSVGLAPAPGVVAAFPVPPAMVLPLLTVGFATPPAVPAAAAAALPLTSPAAASVPVLPAAFQQPMPFLSLMTAASAHAPSTVSQAVADLFVLPLVMGRSTKPPVMALVPALSPAAAPSLPGAVGSEAVPGSSVLQLIAASPASVPPTSLPSPSDRRLSHSPPSQEAGSDSDDLPCSTLSRG